VEPLLNGDPTNVYARAVRENGTSSLHKIVALEIAGDSRVSVREMPLQHRRVGDVTATYGSFEAVGHSASLIATAYNGRERVVTRVRNAEGGPVREEILSPYSEGTSGAGPGLT